MDTAAPDVAGVPVARIRPRSSVVVGVWILVAIGVVASLYLARAFFVPLLIGILTSYALRPVVDWLKALHIRVRRAPRWCWPRSSRRRYGPPSRSATMSR